MKNLLRPALIGVGILMALPLSRSSAQMPFTASPMPNAAFGRGAFAPPASNPPPAAPASAVPGMVYGISANGYPGMALSTEPIDPDHKLSRGDRLSYCVVEDRDDKVIPLVVTDSGQVDVPLIHLVKAQGRTAQQLTAEIKSRLEQEYYYHATVVLGLDAVAPRVSRGTVFVGGQVVGQGSVELPLDSSMTVSQAITKVGGFKEFAKDDKVRVVRKGGPKNGYIVNVKAVQRGDMDKDFVLQPGDQVFVDESKFKFSY